MSRLAESAPILRVPHPYLAAFWRDKDGGFDFVEASFVLSCKSVGWMLRFAVVIGVVHFENHGSRYEKNYVCCAVCRRVVRCSPRLRTKPELGCRTSLARRLLPHQARSVRGLLEGFPREPEALLRHFKERGNSQRLQSLDERDD